MVIIIEKALWEQPAPVPVQKEDEPQPAEAVAERTRELLDFQGWCLWKCSTPGGDIIAIVIDENVEEVPRGYPTYTEVELGELCQDDVSEASLRLVHEVKKLAGAKVITEITDNKGGNDGEVSN